MVRQLQRAELANCPNCVCFNLRKVARKVYLLKVNPVNAYLGPFIEEAFHKAIAKNFLAVVYGGP
jgi:hypothetical protein